MVVALVARFEIDFSRIMLARIYEMEFKNFTTYLFHCLIFQLCMNSDTLDQHYDKLIHPTGTLDVGLISDEATVVAPHKDPLVEVPPLVPNLVDMVDYA